MPKIPTYTQSVADEPFRAPKVPTEAPLANFGGGEAAAQTFGAAANIGEQVQRIAGEKYRQDYQNAVNLESLRVSNQIASEAIRIKTQVQQAKGMDAQKAADQGLGDFDKFYNTLDKSIQNDDVKRIAAHSYSQHQEGLNAFGQHYAAAELQQYDQNEFQSFLKIQQDSASVDTSPANLAVAAKGQELAIQQYAQRNGKPPEWVTAMTEETRSGVYFSALRSMLGSGQDRLARDFYANNKDEFKGNDAVRAAEMVERESILGEAQRMTDDIFQTRYATDKDRNVTATYAPENMDQVREHTQKIDDPKLREAVEHLSKTRIAEDRYEKVQAYNAKLEQAQDLVERTASTRGLPDGLRTSHLRELERRAYELRSGEKKVMDDTAWKYFIALKDMAASPETRDRFLAIPAVEYRNRLPDKQFEDLLSDRTGLLKGDKSTLNKMEAHRTDSDVIDDGIDKLKIRNEVERDAFKRVAYERLTLRLIANQGKPLSNVERQQEIDKLGEQVTTDKRWWWFDKVEPRYQMIERQYAGVDLIPAVMRKKIEDAMRATGEPITRARTIELFMRYMHEQDMKAQRK